MACGIHTLYICYLQKVWRSQGMYISCILNSLKKELIFTSIKFLRVVDNVMSGVIELFTFQNHFQISISKTILCTGNVLLFLSCLNNF